MMDIMDWSEVKKRGDGSVVVNGRVYWPDFISAKRHPEYDKGRGCKVLRWVIGPNRYTTLYC